MYKTLTYSCFHMKLFSLGLQQTVTKLSLAVLLRNVINMLSLLRI